MTVLRAFIFPFALASSVASVALPPRADILAAGKKAFDAWATRPGYNVGLPHFNCTEGMVS